MHKKKKLISPIKLKIIEISEELHIILENIKGLNEILLQYSLDNIYENKTVVLTLISVINEKINLFYDSYDKFESLLYKENF